MVVIEDFSLQMIHLVIECYKEEAPPSQLDENVKNQDIKDEKGAHRDCKFT
jgi:hypothetical protein